MNSQESRLTLHEKHRQQLEERQASAAIALEALKQHVPFTSVLDVGCGVGAWLVAAQELGAKVVHGIDGPWVDPELLAFDPQGFEARDLNQPFDLGRKFDLVISIEVGEHIKPEASDSLVESIARHGDVAIFSAALPGQGGAGHINEQWPDFWVKGFRRLGFDAFDLIRRASWGNDRVAPWVQQNCFLFIRDPQRVPASLEPYRIIGTPPTIVHRSTYNRLRRRLAEMEKARSEAAQQGSASAEGEAALPAPGKTQAIQLSRDAAPSESPAPTPAGNRPALQQAKPDVVADMLVAAIRAKSPCSLIRLSHCEAKFLAWPHVISPREINRSFKRQFGYTDLASDDVTDIAAEIRSAVACSDIVGVPILTASQMKQAEEGDDGHRLWSLVAPECLQQRLLRGDATITSQNIHLRLMENNFLERVLGVTSEVTLVGCRDLRTEFHRLGFREVQHIAVPEAARTRDPSVAVTRHYPTAFNDIIARIRRERWRGLFFVGAGFLGKAYCREIRLAGGIAVDMGSVMDVWAGVPSRTGYESVVNKFALQAAEG